MQRVRGRKRYTVLIVFLNGILQFEVENVERYAKILKDNDVAACHLILYELLHETLHSERKPLALSKIIPVFATGAIAAVPTHEKEYNFYEWVISFS